MARTPGRRRELGQFFTPRPVVDFAFAALQVFGARVRGARLIDPACGPGEWLAGGLAAGAGPVMGVDCDPAMIDSWREGGLASNRDCLLMVADALDPRSPAPRSFDLVVGNPPFGTSLEGRSRRDLREIARSHRLFSPPGRGRLFDEPTDARLSRLKRFPTELLFLERFVGLAREDGWIAIVLPEGVMANSRWRYVRAWLLGEVTLHAVISLPRGTFRAHATTARTCLLLMRRSPAAPEHQVALAGVRQCTEASLRELLEALTNGDVMVPEAPDGMLPPPLFRE